MELEALGFVFQEEWMHHEPHNYYPLNFEKFRARARELGLVK